MRRKAAQIQFLKGGAFFSRTAEHIRHIGCFFGAELIAQIHCENFA